jgi:integrase
VQDIGTPDGAEDADNTEVAAGVFKHREGNWGFRGNVPGGGGRQFKRVGYSTMAAAYSARIAFMSGRSEPAEFADILLRDWFDSWLQVIRETLRPTTASNYKFAFDRITAYLGDVRLGDLNEDMLRAMYRKMAVRYSTETIATTHGRLRATLRAAVKEHRIPRCVADNVTPPAGMPTRARRTWTFQQLQVFSAYVADQRDSAMWLTWITTGLRRGEMCGLLWPKVAFDVAEITVNWQRTLTAENQIVEGPTKTKSGTRVVPINAQVTTALREWRSEQAGLRLASGAQWAGGDYVFTTQDGRPYHPSSFDDRLAKLAKGAGLPPLTPHELRHTFASRCLEMNMPIKLVSSMLGHSKVETTQNLYQHINPAVAHREADALAERMLG